MERAAQLGRVAVIVNPYSAGGKTARIWPKIRSRLEAACETLSLFETQSPGHAIQLTDDALKAGHRTLIAVGGDGTLNEVVNGILASSAAGGDVLLGLIPQGTGSDFRRTARIPLDETEAIEAIRRGRTRRIDVMRVAYRTPEGAAATRHAINVTSFGMGGKVASRVNRSSKPAGARAAFLTATVATAAGFSGDPVSICLDGGERFELRITNVAVGNGQYHGAGMHVCPLAAMDDGFLDVTIIEKLSLWEIARSAPLLFNGHIYDHPKVHHRRTRALVAESGTESAIEIDGEPLGCLPLDIRVVPRAVRMIVP